MGKNNEYVEDNAMPQETFKSWIFCCQGEWGIDASKNLSLMEDFINGIYEEWGTWPGPKLITFCEYAVTGVHPAKMNELAQEITGPSTVRLSKLAKDTGFYICNGSMIERDSAGLHNTSLIIDPSGDIVHKYSKTHPADVLEPGLIPGQEFTVTFLSGIGRVGTMICYDGTFPETPRALAFNGAEIILWNSMYFYPFKEQNRAQAISHAWANNCYIAMCCGTGRLGGLGLIGNSMIVDPRGIVTAEVGNTTTIVWDTVDTSVKQPNSPFEVMAGLGHQYPTYASSYK